MDILWRIWRGALGRAALHHVYMATVTGALPHTNSPARTWAVTDTNEYKIDSGWHTGTYSIASVQGMNYVYVGNWGNGNASSVYVQKLWLT